MSDKKVDQSGFQLNKKELLAEVPLMLKGPVGALIDFINSADFNHDGKSDLAQVAPFVIKALPVLVAVGPYIDLNAAIKWFVDHDFIKDKPAAEAQLKQLLKIGLEAAAKVASK